MNDRRTESTNRTPHRRRSTDRHVLIVDDSPSIVPMIGALAAMSIASDNYTPANDSPPTFEAGGGDSGGGGASGSFE